MNLRRLLGWSRDDGPPTVRIAPEENTTPLKVSYSTREFALTGLERNISVFDQVAKTGGLWEPHIMSLMARLVRPTDTCLDIGANIGALSLVLADLAPKGQVHSFELSSVNYCFLDLNLLQNRMANARAHAIGLGAEHGNASFSYLPGMEGCSLVDPRGRNADEVVAAAWGPGTERRSESVRIERLDD